MSGAGDVVCEGWLRKSPPEKKLRRYAWKRRWFVLRSGRLTGEPDVLQYYKNQQSRQPIKTINLNLCEQVDAGLSFTKKELESSFVFDLRTEKRVWYLVAESEEDMNRWVTSICLLCGFNPTDDAVLERSSNSTTSMTSMATASSTPSVFMMAGSVPTPYDPVRVQHPEPYSSAEEGYLWLSNCQSHIRPPLGSSVSLETEYNDTLNPPPSAASSSSSSSPSLPPSGLTPSSHSYKTAAWTVAAMTTPLSQSLDATSDFQKQAGKSRCHPSPHPRKHSLDIHMRPLREDFAVHQVTSSSYQIPRPASTPQPPPLYRPSSTPSVDSLTQGELLASIPAPPPRPPKPPTSTTETSSVCTGPATLPRTSSESERRNESVDGGRTTRSSTVAIPGRTQTSCESFPRSMPDGATMFEFSESFNSYFFNKGMVPLSSLGHEEEDVNENYVFMSTAPSDPPVAPRAPPSAPSCPSSHPPECNYVPMTPHTAPVPSHALPPSADLAFLGRQVPPPAHMGFRNSPLIPVVPVTPPLHRSTPSTASRGEPEVVPPPIHRNLKPQRKVKPAPLEITPLPQDWQEVPPPVRSPVTQIFRRGPSSGGCIRPHSAQSSSPSSDSDDLEDSYVAMVPSNLSLSAGEQSLRLMLHRASEGGASSPLLQRPKREKQVEYLDLDLHTGRSTPTRQKRCTTKGRTSSSEQGGGDEERARGERTRVDYVVVDPKRTKALKNTREAWHDGRMSTEKEKT
ncbi:GRB2-associated-binding protein 1 isoform X1 [Oryzias melastigma]|uniref:GRB2-associated-binding protein 1-like n=1 Tax=Oryzias melastigma TaxID=30732 RepID=A0A3B3B6P9_ORYME|nr:GRB2-associated-binding protein 1 isoform X1 [Oryzias melastigma]